MSGVGVTIGAMIVHEQVEILGDETPALAFR
jgi:hypothetical protein